MLDLDARLTGLPPAAQDKLRSLQDTVDAAWAVSQVAGERREEARDVLRHADAELHEIQAHGRRPDKKLLEAATAAKATAVAEVARRSERTQAAQEEWQKAGVCPLQITTWLRRLMGTVEFTPFTGTAAPALRRGEATPDAVARTRGEIAQAKADLHHVASAPVTSAEAKAAVRRQVEALAEAGAPDVGPVLEGEAIRWPTVVQRSHNGEVAIVGAFDARALLAWLHKPALLARLDAEVDAIADDKRALSAEQRQAEEARVRAALLVLERAEEDLIASAPEGVTIWRRADADPRAVLGLADSVPGYAT